ncbi:hypothetical protein [Aureimonas leprariae]|uniref:Uncharacterized protein n=1 Tax=Plantimonas leprariae TaxID=2615207 RepID=A0A7V7PKK0_9HYPH|nr:hypothetical protein [Aureimonas leprariae]KAB0676208.1 hypothetical protein F6X38_21950 [Aureimonas leprariae]
MEWLTNGAVEQLALSGLSPEFADIRSIVLGLGFEYPGPYTPRIRRALEQATSKVLANRSPQRLPAAWSITTAGRRALATRTTSAFGIHAGYRAASMEIMNGDAPSVRPRLAKKQP